MERNPEMKRFTLIELLVVIAIIAILAAMLLAGPEQSADPCQDDHRSEPAPQLGTAVLFYANDNTIV